MTRALALPLLLASCAPAYAATPALSLTNLKAPVARICGTLPATSTAQLWAQLTACPSAMPMPTPVPTPTPAPTPTPSAPVVLMSEGDSLSMRMADTHVARYADAHPGLLGNAVGGSAVQNNGGNDLVSRFAADAAQRPTHVTVLIGANDMTNWQDAADPASQPAAWLASLFAYTDRWRAAGVRVAVGTLLSQCYPANAAYNASFNRRRALVNPAIRAAVGSHIDAVIDFAATAVGSDAAACDPALFMDPVHPTPAGQKIMHDAAYLPTVTAFIAGPAPAPTIPVQLAAIPSNYDTSADLVPMAVPPSMAPDDVGAFRMTCKPSHNAYDDPIVYPGQPGASHLHTFFGNTLADAYSTYASLRTSGESTCHTKLNRSAYWIPAMMNGRGQVVMPDFLTVYYKRWPAGSQRCKEAGICIPIPRGLRMVFGRKMTGEVAANPFERNAVHFDCQGTGAVGGTYQTLAEAATHCPAGAEIGAINNAPSCWNGTQLDSADHRSHLAFFINDPATGVVKCPATHPYVIPAFTLSTWYTTDATLDRTGNTDPALQTWYFASDRMAGMPALASGRTYHSDWFGAWDDAALDAWQTNCIDKLLSCTTGNLGNGTGMRWTLVNFVTVPNTVAPPVHP